jgi:hypothetical protein
VLVCTEGSKKSQHPEKAPDSEDEEAVSHGRPWQEQRQDRDLERRESGGFTEADDVLSTSGTALGTDVSDCTAVSSTKADCTGVVGLDGGLLDSRFSLNFATGAIKGTITGGTMAYRHATGTISGSSFNGGAHLTVSYH